MSSIVYPGPEFNNYLDTKFPSRDRLSRLDLLKWDILLSVERKHTVDVDIILKFYSEYYNPEEVRSVLRELVESKALDLDTE